MRKLLTLALILLSASAGAKPLFEKGGVSRTAAATSTFACDGGSSVCARVKDGQTFVTWADPHTGASGANFRFRVYRSAAPITAGNFASAELAGQYILNNSGQLLGGNPDINGGQSYTQANRQNAANAMVRLTDLGTPLTAFTGLFTYTALAPASTYYAVVETSTTDGSPTFVGAVGPMAETVAPPLPIKYYDSLSRTIGGSYGKITAPAGKPIVLKMHGSDSSGGAATDGLWGDYWNFFMPGPPYAWQPGKQAVVTVLQDNGGHYPSLVGAIEIGHRDTIWNSQGTGGLETAHYGLGMSPLSGTANRLYLTGKNKIVDSLSWAITHYGTDPNQVHWQGQSMGAWGGANTGLHLTSPSLASLWLAYPVWRLDHRLSSSWPGLNWATSPFQATVGAAPSTLGTVASNVLLSTGAVWGGDGGYADTPAFIAANPGQDLPFTAWNISPYDPYPASGNFALGFLEQLQAVNAFKSANRGFAFVWATMDHEGTPPGFGVVNCDAAPTDATVCYGKNLFKLNQPYVAFANSSIDDNPGTATPTANGLLDGDSQGCINCGFKWTFSLDTANALNFTVDNVWMDRSPTVLPSTTLTGTLASTGTGTVTVTNSAGFQTVGSNPYVLIGGTEVVKISSFAGNTLTVTVRGKFGTTSQAHAAGQTVTQFILKPTGPNGGPFSTMTVDVAVRRAQGGLVPTACTVTPFGGSPVAGTLSFNDGIPVLTGVVINSGGATSIACT